MSKLQRAVRRARPKREKPSKDSVGGESSVSTPLEPQVDQDRPPSRSRSRRAQMASQAKKNPEATPVASEEPEAVQKARKRLKGMIEQAVGDAPPEAIGLVLAIVTQETGNHAAANALISEYRLDKVFGLKKF